VYRSSPLLCDLVELFFETHGDLTTRCSKQAEVEQQYLEKEAKIAELRPQLEALLQAVRMHYFCAKMMMASRSSLICCVVSVCSLHTLQYPQSERRITRVDLAALQQKLLMFQESTDRFYNTYSAEFKTWIVQNSQSADKLTFQVTLLPALSRQRSS
jgi:hypothetical protein